MIFHTEGNAERAYFGKKGFLLPKAVSRTLYPPLKGQRPINEKKNQISKTKTFKLSTANIKLRLNN